MKRKLINICLGLFTLTLTIKGQDVIFSQFYLNSLDLNPANAGIVNDARLFLRYRNQWPAFGSTFVTYQGSFDKYIKSINAGLGINIIRDNIAGGALSITRADIVYAKRYKLNNNNTFIQAGLQGTFQFFNTNGSNIDANLPTYQTTQPDVAVGFVTSSRYTRFGVSVDHLNTGFLKINYTFIPSPIKISAFYTRDIKVYNPNKLNSTVYIVSPSLLVQKQSSSLYVNYGLNVRKENLMGGIFMRSNFPMQMTNAIFAIGITLGNWQFGYSYDYNFLSLKNMMPVTGAHEVTIIATFPPDPTRQRYGPVPCPKYISE